MAARSNPVDVCDPEGSIESVILYSEQPVIIAKVLVKKPLEVVGNARGLFFLSDGSEVLLRNGFKNPAGFSEAFESFIWLFLFDMDDLAKNGRPFYTASGGES